VLFVGIAAAAGGPCHRRQERRHVVQGEVKVAHESEEPIFDTCARDLFAINAIPLRFRYTRKRG
jgi:hypothetical protein